MSSLSLRRVVIHWSDYALRSGGKEQKMVRPVWSFAKSFLASNSARGWSFFKGNFRIEHPVLQTVDVRGELQIAKLCAVA